MATFQDLYADQIFIKGELINPSNHVTSIEFNKIQDNVDDISAVVNGLTGGQPSDDLHHDAFIQTRIPTNYDDISENWNIGNIWVTMLSENMTAYVCVDNSERNAKWKICSLEINDEIVDKHNTYSSQKITDEFQKQKDSFNYLLTLKANIKDVDIALSSKADTNTIKFLLDKKANISDMDNKLNLKSDVVNTYTKNEVDSKIDAIHSSIISYQEFPSFEIKNTTGESLPLSNTYVGITVSGSSILPNYFVYNIAPYTSFNKKTGDGSFGWTSANTFFGSNYTTFIDGNTLSVKNGTTFNYYTIYRTKVSLTEFIGKQWLQIDCGESKLFKGFKINQRNIAGNNIKDYHICGSNDGNTFVSLFHITTEQNSLEIVHSLSYSSPFKYYRLVIEDLQDGGNGVNHYCSIQEFALLEPHNNNELNRTVDLLNSWIKTGKLNVSGISYFHDPIRENY